LQFVSAKPSGDRPAGLAAFLIILGLGVVSMSLAQGFVLPLFGWPTARAVAPWLGVLDSALSACALMGLYLWTRSRLWLAVALALAAVAVIGVVFWADRGTSASSLDWLAYTRIAVMQGVFVLMGVALLVRRTDGPPGISVAAGITILCVVLFSIVLWTGIILHYELKLGGRHSAIQEVIQIASFAHRGGVDATNALLIGFFAGVLAQRRNIPVVSVNRPGTAALLQMGAAGALLIGMSWAGLHSLLIELLTRPFGAPPSRAELLTFGGLYSIGSMLMGMGYLGQSRLSEGSLSIIAALGIWIQPVAALVLVLAVGRSSEPILWSVAALCQLVGALSFLVCSHAVGHGSEKGKGRLLGLLTAILLSLSAIIAVLASLDLWGHLPGLLTKNAEGPWVAKLLVTVMGLVYVGAYLSAALYQLNIADRVHFIPNANSPPRA